MIVLLNCLMLLISIFSYIDIVDMSMTFVVGGLGNGLMHVRHQAMATVIVDALSIGLLLINQWNLNGVSSANYVLVKKKWMIEKIFNVFEQAALNSLWPSDAIWWHTVKSPI